MAGLLSIVILPALSPLIIILLCFRWKRRRDTSSVSQRKETKLADPSTSPLHLPPAHPLHLPPPPACDTAYITHCRPELPRFARFYILSLGMGRKCTFSYSLGNFRKNLIFILARGVKSYEILHIVQISIFSQRFLLPIPNCLATCYCCNQVPRSTPAS